MAEVLVRAAHIIILVLMSIGFVVSFFMGIINFRDFYQSNDVEDFELLATSHGCTRSRYATEAGFYECWAQASTGDSSWVEYPGDLDNLTVREQAIALNVDPPERFEQWQQCVQEHDNQMPSWEYLYNRRFEIQLQYHNGVFYESKAVMCWAFMVICGYPLFYLGVSLGNGNNYYMRCLWRAIVYFFLWSSFVIYSFPAWIWIVVDSVPSLTDGGDCPDREDSHNLIPELHFGTIARTARGLSVILYNLVAFIFALTSPWLLGAFRPGYKKETSLPAKKILEKCMPVGLLEILAGIYNYQMAVLAASDLFLDLKTASEAYGQKLFELAYAMVVVFLISAISQGTAIGLMAKPHASISEKVCGTFKGICASLVGVSPLYYTPSEFSDDEEERAFEQLQHTLKILRIICESFPQIALNLALTLSLDGITPVVILSLLSSVILGLKDTVEGIRGLRKMRKSDQVSPYEPEPAEDESEPEPAKDESEPEPAKDESEPEPAKDVS